MDALMANHLRTQEAYVKQDISYLGINSPFLTGRQILLPAGHRDRLEPAILIPLFAAQSRRNIPHCVHVSKNSHPVIVPRAGLIRIVTAWVDTEVGQVLSHFL